MSDHNSERGPLGWSESKTSPDVSVYFYNIRQLAGLAMDIDGAGPPSPDDVTALMFSINQHVDTAERILESRPKDTQ